MRMQLLTHINRIISQSCVLIILALVLQCSFNTDTASVASRAPPTVKINKCCRIGEQLDLQKQCVVGGSEKWVPHVYLINKSKYFEPFGDAPKFFKIKEESRPLSCDTPDLFTGGNAMAIFSNGTLFLPEKHVFIDTDDYCVDKDAALVCRRPAPKSTVQHSAADSLTAPAQAVPSQPIRKCCGHNHAYDKDVSNCALLKEGSALMSKRLVNLTNLDVSYGFPHCTNDGQQYTNVGTFNMEDNFNESDGSLKLISGEKFTWNEYCLEHTLKNGVEDSNVDIFTCTESLSSPESIPVEHQQVSNNNSVITAHLNSFFFRI